MAKSDLAAAAVELSNREGGERYLADALAGSLEPYSYVLLDCPPSFGPLTVNALAAATRALVPVQAEYYALEGLSQLIGTINLVKARLNPQLAVAGILLTMADGRTRLAAEVEAELRRHFGELVFATTIPRSVRLAEAPSHGVPAIAYDRAFRRRRRRTGRWRWSLSSVPKERRGLGRGLEVLLGEAGQPELAASARRDHPSQPATASPPIRAGGRGGPREPRSGLQGVLQPIVVRRRPRAASS